MANIPIKVLLDKDRSPFIPFSTTSSIVENGTNRRLDKILGSLDDLQTNNKNSLVSAINEVLVGSGSGAGINIQIVDELPTENISLTTIYFKHMATSKPHNVYEEWMYINDAWELIGTTEMDLSGYATTAMVGDLSTLKTTDKDSVVDAVNELVDKQLVAGDGIELDGNVIKSISDVPIYRIKVSEYIYDDEFISINQQDILKIEDKINKAYKSGLNTIGFIVSSMHNDEQYLLINNSSDIQSKPSSYWLYSIESIHNRYFNFGRTKAYTLLTIQLTISLSWTEDTCKVTSANICRTSLPLLATNNTVEYIPTSDYNPATKKYVDDKVAEGSGSGVDLSNYLAKDNTTEFTPTADYNPSTKKYVDDKFSSVPLIDSYTKTEVDTKLANYLAKDNLTEYTPTSDYHPATKKFVETVVSSIDMSGYYNKTDIDTKFSDYYNKNNVDIKLANYLAKTNTTAFTPTENYHPATKKYVDDKSATVDDQIEEADSIKYLYMDTGLLYKNIDTAGVTININTTGINGNSGSTGAWTKGRYRGDIGSKHAIKMTVKYVATAPLNIIGLGVYLTRALDDTVYQLSANNLIHTELGPYISDTQISDTFKTYSIEAYYKIDPRTIDPNPDTDGTTKVIDVYVKNELTLKVSSGAAQFKQIQVMYDRVYG